MNRRIYFIALTLIFFISLISTQVAALDYPHNSANNISCESCHYVTGTESALLPEWTNHIPEDIDDTQYNTLCWSCHTEPLSGPLFMDTHSSLVIDNGYGDWAVECRVCHNPHAQQFRSTIHGEEAYILDGTVAAVDAGSVTASGVSWDVDQYAGYIVVPNKDENKYNYKILSNDSSTLTVKGTIDTSKVSVDDTFGISYGKLIKDVIKIDDILTYTGASTAIPPGEYQLVEAGAGWEVNRYAGLQVMPNIAAPIKRYTILSNTADTLTLQTPMDLEFVDVGDFFEIVALKTGDKTVKFFNSTGANSFADGDAVYNGVCEVCHTQTDHFQNDGNAPDQLHNNVGGTAGSNCISCHPHENGFAHGGGSGGTGCIECHGHDAGSAYDSDATYPNDGLDGTSQGRGTVTGHSTHTETDSDDLRGPGIYCSTCHDINMFPSFNSGTDSNLDGKIDLSETDVCDTCHSNGGTYDGVNDPDLGAKYGNVGELKYNWSNGVYDGSGSLKAGNEKWCATCHDEVPSNIDSVPAPNVVGDEDGAYTYGTGWGFYKTGHGLNSANTYAAGGSISNGAGKNCDDCHDLSTSHIDGKARSFDCTNIEGSESAAECDADEYRQDYRLRIVNGRNPIELPLPTNVAPNANNYLLCFANNGCHMPAKYVSKSTDLETVFRDDVGDPPTANSPYVAPINAHEYHLNFKTGMFGSHAIDWRSYSSSTISCIACHNVHGSTRLAMVRDGKLVNREPGMNILYTEVDAGSTMTVPSPADLTLDALGTVGTFWDAETSDNLCGDCHGNTGGIAGWIYRRITPAAQEPPTLNWTAETGYAGDGADPDSGQQGSIFHFRVKYTDDNHDLPTSIQVWIDLDGDGYEEGEKHDLWEVDFDDDDTGPGDDGKLYKRILAVNAAPGTYNYRFYARDRNAEATGVPVTSGGTITVTAVANLAPDLTWTGEAGYESDGVDPDIAESSSAFTFRVTYSDSVNEAPIVQEVWIDLNDDLDFDDIGEKITMALVDDGSIDYTSGEIFTLSENIPYPAGSINGTIKYRFYFEDSDSAGATGDPITPLTLTVRESISSCDRTVCSSSCTDTTIQAAVNASADGDHVCVYDGTWAPFAFNGKDITLRSINGPESTIIDGGGSGYVVEFNDYNSSHSDSTLKGFTVTNGVRGINVITGKATIVDCIIENTTEYAVWQNTNATDGPIRPLTIDESVIRNNSGPAIKTNSGEVIANITDTVITGNTAGSGAALQSGGGTFTFERSELSNNEATSGDGGAISFTGTPFNLMLIDSAVMGNTASGNGGGLYMYGNPAGVIVIEGTTFAGNQAVQGGGMYIGDGDYTITNSIFSGNYASGNGGGVHAFDNSLPTFMNCTVAGNSAELGGGIYSTMNFTASLKVHNSILWGNESRSSVDEQIDGPVIDDPGSIYRAEMQYTNIGLDQMYNVFSNQVGNMSIDPLFVDQIPASDAPTTDGDYHILETSPVIDQALVASPPADDIDGEARPNPDSAGIDMGADEYYPSVDLDKTGVGTATAVAADETTINISMPYGKDYNGNNTYTVEYKLSSSGTWLDWGTNPKAHTASPYTDTITGLTTGETYDVRMTYNDADGVNGTNPQTVTVVVLDYETTVGTAAAGMAGVTSIDVSMPYTFDSNGDNTYTVEYKLSSSGTWLNWGTNPKTHTASPYTDTITGLTTGETYDVRMTYNDADSVNGTNPQTVTGILLSVDVTMAGTATAAGAGDTSIDVSMPYTFDNNTDNNYTVEYKPSSSGVWLDWGTNPKAHTASPYTDTITGLTPGESYDVRMTYNDTDGVNGTNPQTVSSIVLTHISTTVGTATATAQGETSIAVSMPYAGDEDGDNTYTVEYKLSSAGTWLDWGTNPKAHTASPYTDTITGLTPGETYDVRMTYNDTDNVNGTNPQTVSSIVLTHNSTTVGSATAAKATETSIDISMPYTGDDNGDNTYTVEYKLSSSGTWLDWGTNPKAHAASPYTDTITGLATDTYDVRMTYNDTDNVNGVNPQVVTDIELLSVTFDIYVCSSGGDETTIQAGITAASAGQTVGVCDGTYSENIDFNGKNITVISENGAASTIIQGSTSYNTNPVVNFSSGETSSAVLDGFTIDNYQTTSTSRGIYVSGATPTIKNSIIENNTANNCGTVGLCGGGGVYITGSVPTFDNVDIQNNTADNREGGGIYITGTGGGATIINTSTISGNTTGINAGYGGGIHHVGTGTLTITGSTIESNHCQRSGGGIYVSSSTAVITGSTIKSNDAAGDDGGGGIYLAGTSSLTLLKSHVLGNRAYGPNNLSDGGGIKIASGGTATITNSVIAGNTADGAWWAEGGGIYNAGTLNLYFSTIADNYVDAQSGGLHAGGTETVVNSIIWGNAGGSQISGTIETLTNTETSSDPSFVTRIPASDGSPTTGGNYDLQSSSICIDTGDATNAPLDDIEGNTRPEDIAGKGDGVDDYDKGAYEYVP